MKTKKFYIALLKYSVFFLAGLSVLLPYDTHAQLEDPTPELNIFAEFYYLAFDGLNQDDDVFEEQNVYKVLTNGAVTFESFLTQTNPVSISPSVVCLNNNNTGSSHTFAIDTWEHDTDPLYTFNSGDDTPCNLASTTVDFANFQPMSNYNIIASCTNSNSEGEWKSVYRYSDGDSQDIPLKFGSLTANGGNGSNGSYVHDNRLNFNSFGDYNGISADINYSNTLQNGNFNSNNEIFYTFSIDECMIVVTNGTFSQFSSTSKMMLFNYNSSSNSIGSLVQSTTYEGSGGSGALIGGFLNAGTYAVVIESNLTNLHSLTIDAYDLTPISPGSITNGGGTVTDPVIQYVGQAAVPINNVVNPSGSYQNIYWERSISSDPSPNSFVDIDGANSTEYTPPEWDIAGNYHYRRRIENSCGTVEYSNIVSYKVYGLTGQVTGKVFAESESSGVSGVTVTLTNKSDIEGYGAAGSVSLSVSTNQSGGYIINNFPIGPEPEEFEVIPSYTDASGVVHEFLPPSKSFFLTEPSNTIEAMVDFEDISSFSLTGRVTHDFQNNLCGMERVEIIREYNGEEVLPRGISDSDGYYSVAITNPGQWTITPVLEGHTFSSSYTAFINSNVPNVDFTDQTFHNLQINITGDCQQNIGTGVFRIRDTTEFICPDLTTSDVSNYSGDIPAKMYSIDLESFSPIVGANPDYFSPTAVEDFVNNLNIVVDLTQNDTILNIIYKSQPDVTIENVPDPPCADLDFPVIDIHTKRDLLIRSWSFPPDALPTFMNGCPLDTGYVIITDNISPLFGGFTMDTLLVDGGVNIYQISGGEPNLGAPHDKSLVADVFDLQGKTNNGYAKFIVEGNRPRPSQYASVAPQIPIQVLRDPPTDNGYASLALGEIIETETTWGGGINNEVGFKAGLNIDWEKGPLKIESQIGASFNWSNTIVNEQTTSNVLTSTTELTTSSGQFPENIGERADIYYGVAYAIKYSINDVLKVNLERCEVKLKQELAISPDSIASTIVKTQEDIEGAGGIIETLRNDLIENTASEDTIRLWQNQVRIWEKLIQDAHKQRDQITENGIPIATYDTGAGGQLDQTYTVEDGYSTNYEFEDLFDFGVFADYQDAYSGFGAVVGGTYNHRWTQTNSKVNTTTSTQEVSYHLEDDDTGDNQLIKVFKDDQYAGHIFKSEAGDSSCPWEEGTARRHDVQFSTDFVSIYGIPDGESAVFNLRIVGTSETGETMPYFLDLVGSTAIGTEPSFSPLFEDVINIGFGEVFDIPVSFARDLNFDILSVEGITFRVLPGCTNAVGETAPDENQILGEVKLNVYFQSPCSNITINEPEDGWIVSGSTGSSLDIQLTDYTVQDLSTVELEYASEGSSSYLPFANLQSNDLNSNSTVGTTVSWNTLGIPDGKYKIRAKVLCGSQNNISDFVSGQIENSPPYAIGYPFPADRTFAQGDLLGTEFNEAISNITTTAANIRLTNNLTHQEYNVNVAVTESRLLIFPLINILELPPASYRLQIFGVEDLYGNVMIDEVDWSFSVGNYIETFCDENTIFYVDQSIPRDLTQQDGFSWESCFVTLNEALEEACPGSTIYVAEGTYYTTDDLYKWNSTVNDSVSGTDVHYEWTHSYNIIGGFPSGGGTLDVRNPNLYPTILSGDANKNGVQDEGDTRTLLKIRPAVTGTLDGFIFEDNYAVGSSAVIDRTGAIFNEGNISVLNCVFRNNLALGIVNSNTGVGAGFYQPNGNATLVNCLFHNNISSKNGGALTADDGLMKIVNSTFSNNTSAKGEAINAYKGEVEIFNSIFYSNGSDPLNNDTNIGTMSIQNSSLDISSLPAAEIIDLGGNMFDNDPLFMDVMSADYSLSSGSNVIDQGLKLVIDTISDIDLHGQNREMDAGLSNTPSVDLGAIEFAPCSDISTETILYVDANIATPGNGLSWGAASSNLSATLVKASACGVDTIYMAQGYYRPSAEGLTDPRTATFNLRNGIVLIGGFAPGGVNHDPKKYATILNGNIGISTVNYDNVYHVVTVEQATASVHIEGVIISGGFANGADVDGQGGAILHRSFGYGNTCKLNIVDCVLKNNHANKGGAIANIATTNGEIRTIINRCNLTRNFASFGGAIYDYTELNGFSTCQYFNNIIHQNNATTQGSAIYVETANNGQNNPLFTNNTIYGNNSASGAAIYIENDGAGMVHPFLFNNIIWENENEELAKGVSSDLVYSLEKNNIQGGYGTDAQLAMNYDTLPYFVGAHVGDFRLDKYSPLIDKASDDKMLLPQDFNNQSRTVNGLDIGAIEYDGVSMRDALPTSLDEVVLNCMKPLHFGIPSDGLSYALYNDSLTVLLGGPLVGSAPGVYYESPYTIMNDTSFQVIVGRDYSMGIDLSSETGDIRIPHHDDVAFDNADSYVFRARVYPDNLQGRQRLFAKPGNFALGLENNGIIFTTYGNQDIIHNNVGIMANEWVELEVHFEPYDENTGTLDIFINDILVVSEIHTVTFNTSVEELIIGGASIESENFDGDIDYISLERNRRPVFQFDFLSAQGSDKALDLKMLENGGVAHHGALEELDRYQVWIPGEDTYVKICPDTLTLNVLVQPETKVQFVENKLDTGYKTLRERIEYACPNDTIRFANILMGDTVKFESQIFLPKDLFIEGLGMNGATTLDGQGVTRLFDSPESRTITFKDLQMINGVHPSSGGALPISDDCTLWNVRMSGHNSSTNKQAISTSTFSNLRVKGDVILEE